MFSHDEVIAYCQRLARSSQTQEVLAAIRNGPVHSQPAGSTDQHAPASYPGRKMAYVIQAESITCEFAFLLELEQNDNVLEFYDRPSIFLASQNEIGSQGGTERCQKR